VIRLSLIVPVYNAEETLPDLLKSIDEQTLIPDDFEAILVDDGATDRSADLVRQYPGMILLSQENRGPGAARNLGTRRSQGAVIVYADADCVLPPTFLADHLCVHEEHTEIDGVHGGVAPANTLRYGSSVLADHLCSWFWDHVGSREQEAEYMASVTTCHRSRRFLEGGPHNRGGRGPVPADAGAGNANTFLPSSPSMSC